MGIPSPKKLSRILQIVIFPGYTLDSLTENQLGNGFTAQLNLAGPPCNAFGKDILNLTLQVTYETSSRSVCMFCFWGRHSLT
jgi:hypothetical protein